MSTENVKLFTSECVSVGHPDHVCDYVSDSILDAILEQDPKARVAVECFAYTNGLHIAGEVTTSAEIDYEFIARRAVREIGYIHPGTGFDADTIEIKVNIDPQSPDIALGTNDEVGGSGDQGMMFGGAVAETNDLMPLPISIARALIVCLTEEINNHINEADPMLRPDAKSQVTIAYNEDTGCPMYVDTVVVSVAHSKSYGVDKVREFVTENIIKPVLGKYNFKFSEVKHIYINPTGNFQEYGPSADVGLTGRKIIVDTYGGYFSHGGGAFSGKDPSKTDRSGAYMARYIAKNIVAAEIADKCEVQLAYAIGVAEPVSISVNTYGTSDYTDSQIVEAIRKVFDMTPAGISKTLGLRDGEVSFKLTPKYGHFGEFTEYIYPWECVNRIDDLEEAISK